MNDIQENVRWDSRLSNPLVVQKYGGSALTSLDSLRLIAGRILSTFRAGIPVVVVVSALRGETNRLLALGQHIAPSASPRELDALAATGEQSSAALMALAIIALGGRARSFLGSQLPILTDSNFGSAQIRYVDVHKLNLALAQGEIPVVAGFQGVDAEGNITTLGRGGSDTTAVSIAAAMGAAACQLFKDVDGVFSVDPRTSTKAIRFDFLNYSQMLSIAQAGAKVVHPTSVAIGAKFSVPIEVRSPFHDGPGTRIGELSTKGIA